MKTQFQVARHLGLLVSLLCVLASWVAAAHATQPIINKREKDWINALSFHPDAGTIAAAVQGQINFYDNPAGSGSGKVTGHSKYVQGVAFSPVGGAMFTIGWDGKLIRWRVAGGGSAASQKKTQNLATRKPQCLAVFADGTKLATNGQNEAVDVFDATTLQRETVLKGLKSTCTSLISDAARGRLIAGDKKGNLAVWNVADGTLIKKWGGHGKKITGLAVDRTSGDLFTGDAEGRLKRWRADDLDEIGKYDCHEPVRAMQASQDGRFLYVALKSGTIRLLDGQFGQAAPPLQARGRPNCLAIDQRGRYLACGTDANQLHVWDLMQIREVQIAYDIPAHLEIEAHFDDAGALIPNHALDGGEKVELTCRIKNVGEGTAYDSQLNVSCDNSDISFPASLRLGDLMPGDQKSVVVPLEVSLEARDGKAEFILHVAEKKKNDARSALGVTVRYLPKPELAITSIELYDRDSGNTFGDDDGIPENNETVEVEVQVTNRGQGPAWRNTLALTDRNPGIVALIDEVDLPPIPADGSVTGRIRLKIPKTYAGGSLAIGLEAVDAVTGKRVSRTQSWAAQQNVPVLAAIWELDSPLRNGGQGSLVLTLQNTGNLDAENIDIRISNDRGLTVYPATASLPALEAGGRAREFPFTMEIPDFFEDAQVVLRAEIAQANFTGTTAVRAFDIELSRPVLKIQGLPETLTIARGDRLYLDLYVANEGGLDARDVKVVVASADLENYSREFRFDRVAGGSTENLERIAWRVPTGQPTGPIEVSVQVTQSYFGPVSATVRAEIVAEQIARNEVQATTPSGGVLAAGGGGGGGGGSSGGGGGRGRSGVKLAYNDLPETVYDPSHEFEIIAQSMEGIRNITGFVNGQRIYNLESSPSDLEDLQDAGNMFLKTEISLRNLRVGQDNEVEFRIIPQVGEAGVFTKTIRFEEIGFAVAAELDKSIDVNRPRKTGRRNPNAVALLIGISDYANVGDVQYARQDVLAVKQTLINTLGYDERNIITLLDSEATKGRIGAALTVSLKNKVAVMDRPDVFVYYSGHGAPGGKGQNRGYFLPHDGLPGEMMVAEMGYAASDFNQALAELDAGSITVAIDACFSGVTAVGEITPGGRVAGVAARGPVPGRDNCVVFSASSGEETSWWHEDKKHGLFTYFFLKGLQGAAAGEGERLTAGKLRDYLVQTVPATALSMDKEQNPDLQGLPSQVVLPKK